MFQDVSSVCNTPQFGDPPDDSWLRFAFINVVVAGS